MYLIEEVFEDSAQQQGLRLATDCAMKAFKDKDLEKWRQILEKKLSQFKLSDGIKDKIWDKFEYVADEGTED